MGITERIGAQFRKPTGLGGALSTFVMNTINRKQYAATERELSLMPGARVLDVGYGNGFMLQRLIAHHGDCEYYGIEISRDMLAAASKRNEKAVSSGRLRLSFGDIVRTEFEDGFFDTVYTVNTVYFWDDLEAGLSEVKRIIKVGGVFVNTVYSREWLDRLSYTKKGFAKYRLDELQHVGERCGLSVRIVPIANGKSYCLVYVKECKGRER
ncbi:MAG: class I SAM-dependent methyltransferase [Clostridiales Family XIII bacterium]|jgi:SAM-dependent methyltransferase|nr:class I SAM-dependent methyltransferase [Clostridiales Family XIII bacterium]